MFVKAMKRLTLHQGKIYYPHHLYGGDGAETLEAANNNRTQFIINLRLGLIALMRDRVSHKVYTNEAMTEDEIKAQFERKPDAERS
jgi:hypothetical protein